jgi:hypothetical protein
MIMAGIDSHTGVVRQWQSVIVGRSLHLISRTGRTGRTGTACLGRLEPGDMNGERYTEWLNVKLTVIDSSLFLSSSDVPKGSELH